MGIFDSFKKKSVSPDTFIMTYITDVLKRTVNYSKFRSNLSEIIVGRVVMNNEIVHTHTRYSDFDFDFANVHPFDQDLINVGELNSLSINKKDNKYFIDLCYNAIYRIMDCGIEIHRDNLVDVKLEIILDTENNFRNYSLEKTIVPQQSKRLP